MISKNAKNALDNKVLDTKVNLLCEIKTWREFIDGGHFIRSEEVSCPRYEFNRTKYNRMDGYEQAEYEKKLKETKIQYRLFLKDGGFYNVSKTVFDYFNNKK